MGGLPSLAVDVGQSGSRAALLGGGGTLDDGPGLRAGEDLAAATGRAVAHAAAVLAPDARRLGTRALGLAGLNGARPDAKALLAAVRGQVDVARLVAADDSVTAYLGAIGARAGVNVAAGTGVAVLAVGD